MKWAWSGLHVDTQTHNRACGRVVDRARACGAALPCPPICFFVPSSACATCAVRYAREAGATPDTQLRRAYTHNRVRVRYITRARARSSGQNLRRTRSKAGQNLRRTRSQGETFNAGACRRACRRVKSLVLPTSGERSRSFTCACRRARARRGTAREWDTAHARYAGA